MSEREFKHYEWHCRRTNLLLNSSEGLLLMIAAVWGTHLLLVRPGIGYTPVSLSLAKLLPDVPIWLDGLGLLVTVFLHFIGITLRSPGLRRRCIFAQMLFFMYAWWALVLSHADGLGCITLLLYITGCSINYLLLMPPRKEPRDAARSSSDVADTGQRPDGRPDCRVCTTVRSSTHTTHGN